MSASKAQSYLHFLDAARCNGDWDAVPELVRKITKHAGASRKCLTQTALLDHDISPQRLAHTRQTNSTIVASSSPLSRSLVTQGTSGSVATSTLVSLSQLAKALEEEIARFKAENAVAETEEPEIVRKRHLHRNKGVEVSLTSAEDIYQSEVTLAYLHHLLNSPKAVLQTLPHDLPPASQITQEWTRVCSIKAICLRGLALEGTNKRFDALETYKSLQLPDVWRGDGGEASYWTRKSLARFAVVSWDIYRGEQSAPVLAEGDEQFDFEAEELGEEPLGDDSFMEASEHDHTPAAGLRMVQEKRDDATSPIIDHNLTLPGTASQEHDLDESPLIGAFRAYHAFNTSLGPKQPSTSTVSLTTLAAAKISKEEELSRMNVYKLYLRVVSSFLNDTISRGQLATDESRDEIRAVENVYENLLLKNTKFPRAEEVNADVLAWVDCVVENWKNLGYVGSEAPRVVEILYRAAQKTFHSPRILRHLFYTLTACGNFHDAKLSLDTYTTIVTTEKQRILKGAHTGVLDFDSDDIILTTIVSGIRFLYKHFDDQSPRALELAALIKTWVFEWSVSDPVVIAAVWRGIGLAHTAAAKQTVESSQRSEIQEKAVAAFSKGLEHIPDDIEILYDLSLALAEVRSIDEAVEAARKVVEMEEACVPAWHLLCLLLTARQEWDTAFTITEAIFDVDDLFFGMSSREGLVEVKITQMAIVEVVEGPESAVNMADELLSLYARLFPEMMTKNGLTAAKQTSPSVSNVGSTRGRPTTSATAVTTAPTISVTDTATKSHRRGGSITSVLRRNKHQSSSVADSASISSSTYNDTVNVLQPPISPPKHHTPNKLHRSNTNRSTRSQATYTEKNHAQNCITTERSDDAPHNLPVDQLPKELKALHDDRPLFTRPGWLREPALSKRDEERRILNVLKRIWLVISGLYRRSGMWEDAGVAVGEAAALGGRADADVLAEKGLLAMAQEEYTDATEYFETALAYEADHVMATVGLCQILLLDSTNRHSLAASTTSPYSSSRHPSTPPYKQALHTTKPTSMTVDSHASTDEIIARDRAAGLLQGITKGQGWDSSEAWFSLAEVFERSGMRERAREVLWWVVRLEDGRGVRGWGCVNPKVL